MNIFLLTLLYVALILCYAVPGYVFGKTGFIKKDNIAGLSKVLLYFCQPCLQIYSFINVSYSASLAVNMAIMFAIAFVIQILSLLIMYLALRKKYADVKYRVCTAAGVMGNVGFFGIPLLEKILPAYPEAVTYASVFVVSMNFIAWTFIAYLISGNKKYISVKKAFVNPAVIATAFACVIFFGRISLPSAVKDWISLMGRMTTPLCMIILGLRLGTMKIKNIFGHVSAYASSTLKLVVFPIFVFAAVYFLPVNSIIKTAVFLLGCCPTASITLNLAEIFGQGQETAAEILLLSTILCLITIPLLSMLTMLF